MNVNALAMVVRLDELLPVVLSTIIFVLIGLIVFAVAFFIVVKITPFSVKKEIEERLGRNVSMGALHTALVRLEDKGYIRSYEGESTEERMGRPKKYFQITALGKKAMEYSRDTRNELWRAIPKVALDLKATGFSNI